MILLIVVGTSRDLEMTDLLLVLQQLVTDVGHGRCSAAMIINDPPIVIVVNHVGVLRGKQLMTAARCHRDVERLDSLLEG